MGFREQVSLLRSHPPHSASTAQPCAILLVLLHPWGVLGYHDDDADDDGRLIESEGTFRNYPVQVITGNISISTRLLKAPCGLDVLSDLSKCSTWGHRGHRGSQ